MHSLLVIKDVNLFPETAVFPYKEGTPEFLIGRGGYRVAVLCGSLGGCFGAAAAPEPLSFELTDTAISRDSAVLTRDGAALFTGEAAAQLNASEAVVLAVPVADYPYWRDGILAVKAIPVLWWCCTETLKASGGACEGDFTADGMLTPSMGTDELHWSLHFSARQSMARLQWAKEREQLLARIEERKWIDMAKGILSKTRGCSESEAYELLRKQAMNDRKRMVDVANAIVQAYQLLHKP
ncbi:ANTAR domain-containing response regulator [Paenibacillus sp. CN-4]|uniref:ANTAR domain-containing response regulator n=1 Tax=Paenibacillus nanchangensis TaxID=3348343 RepID=UPI00397D2D6D